MKAGLSAFAIAAMTLAQANSAVSIIQEMNNGSLTMGILGLRAGNFITPCDLNTSQIKGAGSTLDNASQGGKKVTVCLAHGVALNMNGAIRA